MSGLSHIDTVFAAKKAAGRAALMPYLTLGYPDIETSIRAVTAAAQNGADLLELGVPFSDPLADGPTIQHSTQIALEQGVDVLVCFQMVTRLRQAGVSQPLLLMGYVNPILAFGVEKYVQATQNAGADGLIIPDLPPEEAAEVIAACQKYAIALVFLLSPASPPERIQLLTNLTSGFLYLVSLTGVTGARTSLSAGLPDFVARAKAAAHTPVAVGFGISTPEQAASVGQLADGVIVGSALINAISKAKSAGLDPAQAAGDFVKALYIGLNQV
jgi:tryptophan synthase alpha chain